MLVILILRSPCMRVQKIDRIVARSYALFDGTLVGILSRSMEGT